MPEPLTVCVFCASSRAIDPRYLALAEAAGKALAARGWVLVTGGGSVSMMGEVARAARRGGGHTIGVIPQTLVDMEVADHDADELVITQTMRQRKAIMDERSDAFLALPGGIGTLEELMEVWTSRHLSMHLKPIVVLDPWGDFGLLRAQIDHWVQAGFVSSAAAAEVQWAEQVDEALDAIEARRAMLGPGHV